MRTKFKKKDKAVYALKFENTTFDNFDQTLKPMTPLTTAEIKQFHESKKVKLSKADIRHLENCDCLMRLVDLCAKCEKLEGILKDNV